MKMSAEYHTRRWYEEKKRLKRGKVDGYRGKSLIIYRPVYLFRSTTKPLKKSGRKEERSGVGKVEVMRRDERCGDGEDKR